jgi:hypothetical protein
VNAIPYVGTRLLRRPAALTLLVRLVLALVLVVLVVAAVFAARSPRVSEQPFLPPDAGGMIVLDLSASITSDTYSRIQETLRQLVSRGGRYGLVVFSNNAYEALPPGTPASALEPIIRYFSVPNTPTVGAQPFRPTRGAPRSRAAPRSPPGSHSPTRSSAPPVTHTRRSC